MLNDIQELWRELPGALGNAILLRQFALIGLSLLLAWGISSQLDRNIMKKTPDAWSVGIGGVSRVLFPMLALAFVFSGKLLLRHWQHTGLLALVATLLVAMAVIRLAVYAMRYIFQPSGWLRTAESAVATVVWVMVVLYFTGFLPELLDALEEVSFSVGKYHISLLLLLQAV